MKNSDIDSPIFMIGMPRSGTTAISEAIALHKDLGWFSNLMSYFPDSYWISVISRIIDIPLIGRNLGGKKLQSKGIVSRIRGYLPHCTEAYPIWERCCGRKFREDYLAGQSAQQEEKDKTVALVKNILAFQGKRRFFAKLTGPPRIGYLTSIFPDACFVNVLRDPRAVVSSLMKVEFWRKRGLDRPWWQNGLPDAYVREWVESGRSPVALAAVQWKWIVELTWLEKEKIEKEKFMEIRYEDFLQRPHDMSRDILRRLALADSPETHRYLDTSGKMVDMNRKYRSFLGEDEIRLIEDITRVTAGRAGYDF